METFFTSAELSLFSGTSWSIKTETNKTFTQSKVSISACLCEIVGHLWNWCVCGFNTCVSFVLFHLSVVLLGSAELQAAEPSGTCDCRAADPVTDWEKGSEFAVRRIKPDELPNTNPVRWDELQRRVAASICGYFSFSAPQLQTCSLKSVKTIEGSKLSYCHRIKSDVFGCKVSPCLKIL